MCNIVKLSILESSVEQVIVDYISERYADKLQELVNAGFNAMHEDEKEDYEVESTDDLYYEISINTYESLVGIDPCITPLRNELHVIQSKTITLEEINLVVHIKPSGYPLDTIYSEDLRITSGETIRLPRYAEIEIQF